MNTIYKKDWDGLYQRFESWWKFDNSERPLMLVTARKERTGAALQDPGRNPDVQEIEDGCLNEIRHDIWTRNGASSTEFLAESFPNTTLNFGPGAMAAFLDCTPNFSPNTVWYNTLFDDAYDLRSLKTRRDTEYYIKARDKFSELYRLANNDYIVTLPDIIDSMDTLSSILGPEKLLYSLIDSPDDIKAGSDLLDDIYFDYFDEFREMLANDDDIMSVQAFSIIGKRVAKLQCDFCAMISSEMFDYFVAPSIQKYCNRLSHALYHIDGEDEIRHVDSLIKIKGLDAFQWIPKGFTTGTLLTDPSFYPLFDKIHEAEKGLFLSIYRGGPDDWADETQRLINRYGNRGMYFLYPTFPDVKTAEKFILRFTK